MTYLSLAEPIKTENLVYIIEYGNNNINHTHAVYGCINIYTSYTFTYLEESPGSGTIPYSSPSSLPISTKSAYLGLHVYSHQNLFKLAAHLKNHLIK